MNEFCEYLVHHGIENQRWGVRNGPPYPLSKKAHKHVVSGRQDKDLEKFRNTSIGETTGYSPYYTKGRYGYDYKTGMDASRHFKIMQYKDGKSTGHGLDELIKDPNYMSKLRTLGNHGKISGESDLSATNPIRSRWDTPGTTEFEDFERGMPREAYTGACNNCLKCSSVLALRAKGYDVTAGLSGGGMLSTSTEKYWDGARKYQERSAQNIESRMRSFGNKGMGEIQVVREEGNGHSMFFQNERQADGQWKPVVYDGQTGQKIGDVATALARECHDFSYFAQIVRLDDATPNFKNMAMDDVFVPRTGSFGLEKPKWDGPRNNLTYWDF